MTLGKLEAMLPRAIWSDSGHLADLMGQADLIIACTLAHSLGIPEKMAEHKSRAEKAISKIILHGCIPKIGPRLKVACQTPLGDWGKHVMRWSLSTSDSGQ